MNYIILFFLVCFLVSVFINYMYSKSIDNFKKLLRSSIVEQIVFATEEEILTELMSRDHSYFIISSNKHGREPTIKIVMKGFTTEDVVEIAKEFDTKHKNLHGEF